MQKSRKRLQIILLKYRNLGFSDIDYVNLDINKKSFKRKISIKSITALLAVILLSTIFYLSLEYLETSECLIQMPSDASKWFREPESCSICNDIYGIDKIKNTTPNDFYNNYFYKGRPVVVTDATNNWHALNTFNFNFFRDLYKNDSVSSKTRSCQFFPYKTEFQSLNHALKMTPERANLLPGEKPWYIGWSNCNDAAGKILRRYYTTPYFLPNISENMALNWIFMGGSGYGAHMHVDNVHYPSWQAQITGKKMWRLAPPPECYYKCRELQVTLEPGEMFVVDTNRWYHQTFILAGDISITIGSEFD